MSKLKLAVDPTFKAEVSIPVAGCASAKIGFTFKHRTRDELEAFFKRLGDLKDAALILEIASGWELSDAFTEKNLNILAQNYIGAPHAIFDVYTRELTNAREKN